MGSIAVAATCQGAAAWRTVETTACADCSPWAVMHAVDARVRVAWLDCTWSETSDPNTRMGRCP